MAITAEESGCRLWIEGEVTVAAAAELHARVAERLPQCPILEIDLSGVRALDTAGIQLLMATKRQCQAEGRGLQLIGHPSEVVDTFDLLGLHQFFGDPVFLPGQDEDPTMGSPRE